MKVKYTILLLLVTGYSTCFAQLQQGNQMLGGSLGFSGSKTTAMIGANYEYQLPQAELGTFGVGFMGRYWLSSDNIANSVVNSTVVTLASQINYNFNTIGNGKFVPFAGIAFGYRYVTTKYTSYDGYSLTAYDQQYKNGFLLWGQGGFRYFFSRKVAGSLRFGLSNLDFSTIEFGIDYKFGK
jgi:hypothetical protein